MRHLYILFILLCASFYTLAQETTTDDYYYFIPKSSSLSLGLGVPSTTQIAVQFISLIDQDAKATPQFTLKYEYAINEHIGIGAYAGFYTGETDAIGIPNVPIDSIINDPGSILGGLLGGSNSSTYRVNVFTIGGQLQYHLYRFPKLDTYTTVRAGYNFISVIEDGANNVDFLGVDVPGFEYFAGAGARYYFTPHLAFYGEVGNSILSPFHINFGGTFRF